MEMSTTHSYSAVSVLFVFTSPTFIKSNYITKFMITLRTSLTVTCGGGCKEISPPSTYFDSSHLMKSSSPSTAGILISDTFPSLILNKD